MSSRELHQEKIWEASEERPIPPPPRLPPIVAKLNRMVDDKQVTAVQIGTVIEKDQVLTSKLLEMVNSSFFGFP